MDAHIADWVQGCDKYNIKITAKAALSRVAEFRAMQTAQPVQADGIPRIPFSKEGFLDALVEWIVSDDQVCFMRMFWILSHYSSH